MGSRRPFVHLHNHTSHSVLDGAQRLDRMCEAAEQDDQPAIGISDHGTLSGAWQFARHATNRGLKPIVGAELYLAVTRPDPDAVHDCASHPGEPCPRPVGSRHDPQTITVPADGTDHMEDDSGKGKVKRYEHVTVFAESAQGWSNLVRINNAAQHTYSSKPLADLELLAEHADGLIVLTGCLGGPIAGPLLRGDDHTAETSLAMLVEGHGRDNVFVEVMSHGVPGEDRIVLPKLVELADRFGLRTVATNDAHFTAPEDRVMHEAWLAAQTGTTLSDPDRFQFNGDGYHLRTANEMRTLFDTQPGTETACDTTLLIADRVAPDVFPERRLRLPAFPVPGDYQPSPAAVRQRLSGSTAYLYDLIGEGAKTRYGAPVPDQVQDRLRWEFETIVGMRVGDYFLIVWDMIQAARNHGIRVGPGRGSSAGCVIAYCLGITQVEPLAHDLLFERFLNPARTNELPDIDVDFEKSSTGWVMNYLRERWGDDHVARIGTFGIARSKAALQTAGRALDQRAVGNKLSKLVPVQYSKPRTFEALADQTDSANTPYLHAAAESDSAREVVGVAERIEGLIRNESIHPCGVVVADEPLDGIVPLRLDRTKGSDTAGMAVTQWEKDDVEDAGLLKLDVLGLKYLDIINRCVQIVGERLGEEVSWVDSNPPLDPEDPYAAKAYQMLAEGRTAGIFQLEGEDMTKLVVDMRPTSLDDIAALLALYRPGPLSANMHTRYVERKHGREPVDYSAFTSTPAEQQVISEVLGSTYGACLYQEQLMRLGEVVAGFDPPQRERLRKAVSKKVASEMAAVGDMFLSGASSTRASDGAETKLAFTETTAQALWTAMQGSADYSFNASHTYAYGMVTWATALLKANWPAAYGAAALAVYGRDGSGSSKQHEMLASLQAENIQVLPPDVNRSSVETSVDGDDVLFGLGEIKGVKSNAEAIVAERDANGPYLSFADFMSRVKVDDGRVLSVSVVRPLIDSGAFDQFGPRLGLHKALLAVRDVPEVPIVPARFGVLERAARERECLNIICGEHPLTVLKESIASWRVPVVADHWGDAVSPRPIGVHRLPDTETASVWVLGVLSAWDERSTHKGRMASFELEGTRGRVPGVAFAKTFTKLISTGRVPTVGDIVAVEAKVEVQTVTEQADDGTERETSRRRLIAWDMWPVALDDRAEPYQPEGLSGPIPVSWGDHPVVPLERPAQVKVAPGAIASVTGRNPVSAVPPDLQDVVDALNTAGLAALPIEAGLHVDIDEQAMDRFGVHMILNRFLGEKAAREFLVDRVDTLIPLKGRGRWCAQITVINAASADAGVA